MGNSSANYRTNFGSLRAWLTAALVASAAEAVAADKPLPEWRTDEVGRELVSYASHGAVSQAFEAAQELRNPRDKNFKLELERQRETVTGAVALLGGPVGPVHPVEATRFGTCLTYVYRVRFARGEQNWKLKFRRGTGGWHLTDMHVATLPPRRSLLQKVSSAIDPEPR